MAVDFDFPVIATREQFFEHNHKQLTDTGMSITFHFLNVWAIGTVETLGSGDHRLIDRKVNGKCARALGPELDYGLK